MDNLLGAAHEERIVVDDSTAVTFLGLEGARVLGTPWMILWMERTSRNAIKSLLPDGWDSVGTVVNVTHVSAAGMGAEVTFRASVTEQNGKRVWFRVVAEAAHGVVGEGTHERALIHVERFAERVAANLRK
jgi:predicted thioesterase